MSTHRHQLQIATMLVVNNGRVCTFCILASGVSKGMLPGPFPTTPEEKAAAAKKYNMRVEDYEPFPDNGEG